MRSEHSWESSWGCHGPSPPCHVTHWGPASDPATEFALRFVSLTPCHGFSRSSLATPQKGGGIPRLFVQQSLRFWGSKGSSSGTPDSLTCHPMDDSQPQGCCNRETLVAFSVLTTEVCNGLKLGWAFLCAFRQWWVSYTTQRTHAIVTTDKQASVPHYFLILHMRKTGYREGKCPSHGNSEISHSPEIMLFPFHSGSPCSPPEDLAPEWHSRSQRWLWWSFIGEWQQLYHNSPGLWVIWYSLSAHRPENCQPQDSASHEKEKKKKNGCIKAIQKLPDICTDFDGLHLPSFTRRTIGSTYYLTGPVPGPGHASERGQMGCPYKELKRGWGVQRNQ